MQSHMHTKCISPDAVINDKPSPHSCSNRMYGGQTKPPNMRHVKPSQYLILLLKISVFSNSSGETFIILIIHLVHKQKHLTSQTQWQMQMQMQTMNYTNTWRQLL